MAPWEPIISNPKRDAVDSTILCTIAAGNAVGFLESTVQTLDELLERNRELKDYSRRAHRSKS